MFCGSVRPFVREQTRGQSPAQREFHPWMWEVVKITILEQ